MASVAPVAGVTNEDEETAASKKQKRHKQHQDKGHKDKGDKDRPKHDKPGQGRGPAAATLLPEPAAAVPPVAIAPDPVDPVESVSAEESDQGETGKHHPGHGKGHGKKK